MRVPVLLVKNVSGLGSLTHSSLQVVSMGVLLQASRQEVGVAGSLTGTD